MLCNVPPVFNAGRHEISQCNTNDDSLGSAGVWGRGGESPSVAWAMKSYEKLVRVLGLNGGARERG
jgi:hypothetical protein